MRFEILMAVNMSWVVTPSGLVDRYKSFGRTYCLHLLLNRKTSSISKIQYGFNFFMHVIWICCWMMWLIMLMAWDISERQPMGLLFIPQVSMEGHGGDETSWGKLLTHPPELSGNPTSRDIWEWVGGMHKGVGNLHYQYLIWQQIFNLQ
jgi:hypothetical protein